MSIPNGLCWTKDSKTFYHIDTPDPVVSAYDFDPEKGLITNKRTCIDIPKGMGFPDGCTIDTEGKIWICFWQGACVARFCPESNKMLEKIAIPSL